MARYVALLRGINVGTAKRVAMADLRSIATGLGYTNVATVLNSGNLLFDANGGNLANHAALLKAAVLSDCQVDCSVMVVSAKTVQHAIANNPIQAAIKHPARFLVAFAADPKALLMAGTLAKSDWLPDQIAVGRDLIYLWCEAGVLDSPLSKAFSKQLKDLVTARNWSTLEKIGRLL